MHHLGHTRSVHRSDHILQTPDTFVRTPFPGMRNALAIVHVAPAAGARFTQYTVEFAEDGVLGPSPALGRPGTLAAGARHPSPAQRFVYVLEGELEIDGRTLAAEDYAYLPHGFFAPVSARHPARAAVIEKVYQP